MMLESETAQARRSAATPDAASPRVKGGSKSISERLARVAGSLPGRSSCVMAAAPGRLDLIGGLSAYAGSLMLSMPLVESAFVAAQRCRDATCTIITAGDADHDGAPSYSVPATLLDRDAADGAAILAKAGVLNRHPRHVETVSCVLGAIAELVWGRLIPPLDGGLCVSVEAGLPMVGDTGRTTATVAASLTAMAGICDVRLTFADAAAVCQRVDRNWLRSPLGPADTACALGGKPNTVTAVQSLTQDLAGAMELPDDVLLLGVDCGYDPDAGMSKYAHARTAAFMGQSLIQRIIQHDGRSPKEWNGHLASVSVAEYIERFRDRLPTRLTGSEYLDRFGETGDPMTQVDPDFEYRIRSRTEHHIYENARAAQMLDCLVRAAKKGDRAALLDAGGLMYASHWSYGQRCGLGSVVTDYFVSQLRHHGFGADIYGAKITGMGGGGVVAVLMRDNDKAREALASAVEAANRKTGRKLTVLQGSSPGAMVRGVECA